MKRPINSSEIMKNHCFDADALQGFRKNYLNFNILKYIEIILY